ncbi:MAG: cell division protein ZapE, partial [Mycobacteriaceae bacterium]
MPLRLVDRNPVVPADQLVAQMVPPAMFDEVSFASYIPDPQEPSQAEAVRKAEAFAARVVKIRSGKRGLFGKKTPATGAGLYLDGGFGVGKTHLLASIYHSVPEPKAFGTFVELTHVVGALGFTNAVERLAQHSVLCIDEFELDDPGDTMLVSRLLAELSGRGVSIVATSNTLPGQLGEGRFAAQDFLREIKKLGSIFDTIRVDGPDYRHRDLPPAPEPVSDTEIDSRAAEIEGSTVDDFDELCAHLSTLHPSRYNELLQAVPAVFIKNVHPAKDQSVALRIVVLADRLYDANIPVVSSGGKLDEIFTQEMLEGG